ncbi:MAG: glycosyltransferase family 39 protein [Pseudomonadota bacterium]
MLNVKEIFFGKDKRNTFLLLFIALFIICLWFLPLGFRDLIRSDEGRYAEIAREMFQSGDWITPHLNGLKYFEKPPLHYWATTIFYGAFGLSEGSARLWPAITGFLGILCSLWYGCRFISYSAGILAALIQGSTLWYMGISHFNVLDMSLCFFLQLTLMGYQLAVSDNKEKSKNKNLAAWLIGVGIAGALLSKGLVAILLPGCVFIIDSAWHKDNRPWRLAFQGKIWLITFLIAAPWFIAVSIVNPEFPYFFFIHEHFSRFTTTVHHRDAPFYYFVPILLGGLLPWTFLWLKSLLDWKPLITQSLASFLPDERSNLRFQRVNIIWAIFIFIFFSLSHSKLPSYILPVFPALSWLLAFSILKHSPQYWRFPLVSSVLLWIALLFILPFVPDRLSDPFTQSLFKAYQPYAFITGILMLVGCLGLLWKESSIAQNNTSRLRVWSIVITLWSVGIACAFQGHQMFAPRLSIHDLVENIGKVHGRFRQDIPFYSVSMYEHTLNFYINRTTTLVQLFDEMDFGCKQEPSKCVNTVGEWEVLWVNESKNAYAVMDIPLYNALLKKHIPMRELGRNWRNVIVVRR